MSDLRSVFVDMDRGADLALEQFALATDDGLETAVILSLFTDARAADDDTLPLGQSDRRGWWGDAYPPIAGDRIGSRLWLLRASKQLQASLTAAKEYAEQALAWLVADGAARRVEVETFVARDEVMGMIVRIHRPDGSVAPIRFETLWNQV
ncbi:phage GP46 family protein [Rhodocyclus tenuis]|uniref:Phage gp46-like protein n=1 Tax=Rhodocyclus tenuis TaxID=1066 RepID=A0A840G3U1_RHOTE|nr:phage GP46 family protein [Rhodocyclus tenuis]MBB4246565.1 phage gp46-like protein [Rhodocyclus tenuis]